MSSTLDSLEFNIILHPLDQTFYVKQTKKILEIVVIGPIARQQSTNFCYKYIIIIVSNSEQCNSSAQN